MWGDFLVDWFVHSLCYCVFCQSGLFFEGCFCVCGCYGVFLLFVLLFVFLCALGMVFGGFGVVFGVCVWCMQLIGVLGWCCLGVRVGFDFWVFVDMFGVRVVFGLFFWVLWLVSGVFSGCSVGRDG